MAAIPSIFDYGKTRSVVEVGQVISGKYKLLRLLGDGGMGSVYEAEHLNLGTHVAIKVLHPDLARRAGLIDRFLQEARVSAQIRSTHVCHVTDVEHSPDGIAYIVMELLQGEPLSNVIRREKRLSVPTACEYASQILQALEAAHSLGVIHRDLKPDNVFLTFHGGRPVLKLIDFGIAKLKREGGTKNLTVAGMLMGTPEYMAPEQAYSADKVDVRADLYAVGVMLYEMLSGQPPVSGADPRVLVLKVERGEVTPLVHVAPGVRPELAGFVHRAMAPRAEVRFANATEMRLALEAIVSGKRQNTAPLPNASVAPVPAGFTASVAPIKPAFVASLAPSPSALPYADTHDRAEVGTGTVMGAPAAAALGGSGPPPPMPGSGPPPAMPTYEPTHPPEKRGGYGLIVALAVIALLLGAGSVVAYVASNDSGSSSQPPIVLPTTPTTPTGPTGVLTSTGPIVTAPTPLTPATPLKPPPPVPDPAPIPPPAKRDAGAPAQLDAGGSAPPPAVDAGGGGGGGTVIVVPGIGSFPFPGPRPPLYPPDQPWPPPWIPPPPQQPLGVP